jgi:hypothetical protein
MGGKFMIKAKRRISYYLLLFSPLIGFEWSLNNDLWFLLASGKYVLERGIPHIEPLTLHEGLSFVMQQWLTSVIFRLIWDLGGKLLLLGFIFLLAALFIFIFWRLCLYMSGGNGLVSLLVTLLTSVCVIVFYMNSRPGCFDAILFITELFLLEKYINEKNIRLLLPLPVISVLMINLHGAMWLMTAVFMLPFLLEAFIKRDSKTALTLLISALICLLAGFINPYGLKAMTYVLRSYNVEDINRLITEMKAPDIKNYLGIIIYGCIILVFLCLILSKKGIRLRHALLTLGTLYLTLSAIRSFLLFLLAGVYQLALCLKDLNIKQFNDGFLEKAQPRLKLIGAEACLLLALTLFVTVKGAVTIKGSPDCSGAIDWAAEHYKPGSTIYIGYNDGGYAEYKGLRPYIDPRAEVFIKANNKKEEIFSEYLALISGQSDVKAFIDKYDFDLIYLRKNDKSFDGRLDNYMLVYEDEYSRLYEAIGK